MSTSDHIGLNRTVGGEVNDKTVEESDVIDEVAERERNLRPSVEQEIRAKVDYANVGELNGRLFGQTLAAEERMAAYEWEIERTRIRWDRRQDSNREVRCRETVAELSRERRREFAKRAASVDRWSDPDAIDARAGLSHTELGAVNRAAARAEERLNGYSRVTIARRMAERVINGADVASAVLEAIDELETAPGRVIPIDTVGTVDRREVDIEGQVSVLWEPSHPKIQQVGLLEDESGTIKFTAWKASDVAMVREGDFVRFRSAAKNWYRGQVSVALTGRSSVGNLDNSE